MRNNINQVIGENYIAVKGRDTMRKIVSVTPGVVLTECKYKDGGWRYELWPTEPSECWLTSHTEEEQHEAYSMLLRLTRTLRSRLEYKKYQAQLKLENIDKKLELI